MIELLILISAELGVSELCFVKFLMFYNISDVFLMFSNVLHATLPRDPLLAPVRVPVR
jgi:hypothetical protein